MTSLTFASRGFSPSSGCAPFFAIFTRTTAPAFIGGQEGCGSRCTVEMGVQFVPMHPYSPVPDPCQFPADFGTKRSELPGIRIGLARSCNLLRTLAAGFRSEYETLLAAPPPEASPWTYYTHNDYYDDVDGYMLYAMVRHFRPRRIIEIGSGNTTYRSAQAAERNRADSSDYLCEITAIERYPNPVLRAGFPGLTRLIPSNVQDVPVSFFEELGENDILFIDSSHVAAMFSTNTWKFCRGCARACWFTCTTFFFRANIRASGCST